MGGSFFLDEGMRLLSVVVHNLHVVGVPVVPPEADTPLIVNPDAVLPGPIPLQRFQPIPADLCQIIQAGRCMETGKPRASSRFDASKAPAAEALMERLGFSTSKRKNHLRLT